MMSAGVWQNTSHATSLAFLSLVSTCSKGGAPAGPCAVPQAAPRGTMRALAALLLIHGGCALKAPSTREMAKKYGFESRFYEWKYANIPEKHRSMGFDAYKIRYTAPVGQEGGEGKPNLVLVHGFGGNAEHWRKVLPEAKRFANVYAVDLLGFGFSDKPTPRVSEPHVPAQLYNFETWGEQLVDFVRDVVKGDAFISTNSVGGIAGLSAALQATASESFPYKIKGVQLMDPSLRMLHKDRQPALQVPFTTALQYVLRETPLGKAFFSQIATTDGVRNVLEQAYAYPDQVDEETVEAILRPGLEDGAADVFLDFISNSYGPLPERQIEQLRGKGVPVSIIWGERDPWEPVSMGEDYLGTDKHEAVEEFVRIDAGHCPMDGRPDLVTPLIEQWIKRNA